MKNRTFVLLLIVVAFLSSSLVLFAGKENPNAVWPIAEQMPEFKGGEKALMKYLNSNLVYPPQAVADGIEGDVICKFIVEKDGSVSHAYVATSSGNELLDAEAKRVVEEMPKWKPGRQKGKVVRVQYSIPIKFRLQRTTSEN